ncbi:MAG: hypothetical protein DMG47_09345 [Acidobacteria bacterium]|nr:MAG: hypothetical protein DMG47_09345 [Acidobacteriota bacterium]
MRTPRRSQQAFAKFRRRDAVRDSGQSGRETEQSARRASSAQDRRPSLAQSTSRRIGNASPARTAAPGPPPRGYQHRPVLGSQRCAQGVRPQDGISGSGLGWQRRGSAPRLLVVQRPRSRSPRQRTHAPLPATFSVRAQDFVSENDELLSAIDQLRAQTRGRGIWAMDRGGDRRKLLEPLLERRERFVMRSTGLDRQRHRVTLHHLGACCRLRYQAKIIKIENRQEKVYSLRYGAEPFRLPGREEQLLLVVVAGFGQEPLLLLTNLCGVRDSQSLWWIAQIYLTRWKIEETFRFVKQSYPLEDIRVMRYQRLKNLVLLMTAAAYFATAFLGQKLKLKILCEKLLIISQRFFGIPPFRFYALADGIPNILSRSSPSPPADPPQTPQLLLGWET